MAEAHSACVYAINCTGKSVSQTLATALAQADGNRFMCSKEKRSGKKMFGVSCDLSYSKYSVYKQCDV